MQNKSQYTVKKKEANFIERPIDCFSATFSPLGVVPSVFGLLELGPSWPA